MENQFKDRTCETDGKHRYEPVDASTKNKDSEFRRKVIGVLKMKSVLKKSFYFTHVLYMYSTRDQYENQIILKTENLYLWN